MADLNTVIDELGRAFEEFKETNNQRIAKLAKGEAVSELEQKLERLDAQISKLDDLKADIDDIAKKAARRGGAGDDKPEVSEHREAYGRYIRKGIDNGLGELQQKAMQIAVDADGGYAVPETLDTAIAAMEQSDVAMRRLANVITVGNEQYKKLVSIGGTASGWVGETAARPVTNSPQLAEVAPFFGEIYANPASTQKALDDVFFSAEAWLAEEIGREFAEEEETAYVAGDGTAKPKGILAYTTALTSDATRAFGVLQHVVSGSAAALTPDGVINLVYSLRAGYRNNAAFLMNRLTVAAVRKLKDTTNDYLWRPGLEAGQPSTLLGYAIEESDAMPDVAADALSMAFGDFRRGYLIADVRGVRILRDPFTNKPYVHFYTTKRTGGAVVDSRAIKILKVSA